jgi:hypothetical protein
MDLSENRLAVGKLAVNREKRKAKLCAARLRMRSTFRKLSVDNLAGI